MSFLLWEEGTAGEAFDLIWCGYGWWDKMNQWNNGNWTGSWQAGRQAWQALRQALQPKETSRLGQPFPWPHPSQRNPYPASPALLCSPPPPRPPTPTYPSRLNLVKKKSQQNSTHTHLKRLGRAAPNNFNCPALIQCVMLHTYLYLQVMLGWAGDQNQITHPAGDLNFYSLKHARPALMCSLLTHARCAWKKSHAQIPWSLPGNLLRFQQWSCFHRIW